MGGCGRKRPWFFSLWDPISAGSNNELMNWVDFLNADSNEIIFSWTDIAFSDF